MDGAERPLTAAGADRPLAAAGADRPLAEAGAERPLVAAGAERPLAEDGAVRPLAEDGSERPLGGRTGVCLALILFSSAMGSPEFSSWRGVALSHVILNINLTCSVYGGSAKKKHRICVKMGRIEN